MKNTIDGKKVKIVDGKIVNFEELLKDAEWNYFPIDEAWKAVEH